MTKEDIIRMAREANLPSCHLTHPKALERFAALIRADEREECLKLIDEQIHNMTVLDSYPEQSGAIYRAIINIRARGEK